MSTAAYITNDRSSRTVSSLFGSSLARKRDRNRGSVRAESLAFGILKDIQDGGLAVKTADGREIVFGDMSSSPTAGWQINHPKTFAKILQGGSLGLGESYMNSWWDVEDDRLCDFMGVTLRNELWKHVSEDLYRKFQIAFFTLLSNPASLSGGKRCITHHYDLSNEFFRLFLDDTMTYSCGYECNGTDTLEQMQKQKYTLICKKLGLEKGGELLDAGCGWGGIGLLHTIGVTDSPIYKPDPWCTKHIFPGSRLPRLDELAICMREAGLLFGHVENLRPHYAETLRRRKKRFEKNSEQIQSLGPKFDERFMQMWNYYLQTCEAGFRYGSTQVYQLLFSNGRVWGFLKKLRF